MTFDDSPEFDVTDFTCFCWLEFTGVTTNSDPLILRGIGGGASGYRIRYDMFTSTQQRIIPSNGTGVQILNGSDDITSGAHALACSADGTDLKLYNNGVIDTQTPQTVTPTTSTHPMKLLNSPSSSRWTPAIQAQATVWNVGLTIAEILAMSNGINPFPIRHENKVFWTFLFGNQDPEPDNSRTQSVNSDITDMPRDVHFAFEHMENYL